MSAALILFTLLCALLWLGSQMDGFQTLHFETLQTTTLKAKLKVTESVISGFPV